MAAGVDRRTLVVVLSTLFKVRGGIPRFNQMLCLALDRLSPELGLGVEVISQDDTEEDYRHNGSPWRHVRFVPGGGPLRLSLKTILTCTRKRRDAMLVGLLGMAPLGMMCRPLLRLGYGYIVHGTDAWHEPRRSRRIAARRARFVFAVSADTANRLVQSTGTDPAAIRLLPNTLDPGFAPEREQTATETAEPPEVLTVARLWAEEKMKGVDHMLEAMAMLAAAHPRLRHRIVGKGSDKPRLVRLARTLGIADRVTFEEDLSDEELAEAYRRAAVFALPSGQEGFGIVFLEAMGFGKPCIGGDAGGTPEVIEHGVSGLLVPFGDVAALASALDRLLCDPAMRRTMGMAGLARLEERFVFPRFVERLRGHLTDVLRLKGEGGGPGAA